MTKGDRINESTLADIQAQAPHLTEKQYQQARGKLQEHHEYLSEAADHHLNEHQRRHELLARYDEHGASALKGTDFENYKKPVEDIPQSPARIAEYIQAHGEAAWRALPKWRLASPEETRAAMAYRVESSSRAGREASHEARYTQARLKMLEKHSGRAK